MSNRRFLVDVNEVHPASDPIAPEPQNANATPSDEKTIRRATAQLRLADRSRTIDQVKRLYAVVMGYAVGTCFSNSYSYLSKSDMPTFSSYFTVGSQIVAFISLIFIFFLGTERVLDTRYLDIRNSLPPRRLTILFDLVSLGLTAFWFVVLADTISSNPKSDILQSQHIFVQNLVILYGLDFLILLVQIFILRSHRKERPNDSHLLHVIRCHRGWLISNFAFFVFFGLIVLNDNVSLADISPDLANFITNHVVVFSTFHSLSSLSILILITHALRFFFDFWYAYDLYYPQLPIPNVDDLFTWR